jgi:hypothetical protein
VIAMSKSSAREQYRHFPGVLHEGVLVTNPTASNGGIVSPSHFGFELWETGGGCTAWGLHLPDGREIMVTDLAGESHRLPGAGEPFLVGLHSGDCEQLGIWTMAVGRAYGTDEMPENEQGTWG